MAMNASRIIELASFLVIIAAGCCCCCSRPGRMTTLQHPESSTLASSKEPFDDPDNPLIPKLRSEDLSTPAIIKNEDYRRISGDYAYADLKALLKLIGRVEGKPRDVLR